MDTTTDPRRPVTEYGCTRCQAWHAEGDPLFAEHLVFQAKHHHRRRTPTPAEVFRRLVEEPDDGEESV